MTEQPRASSRTRQRSASGARRSEQPRASSRTPGSSQEGLAPPVVELTYAEASTELDAIVQFFEQNELDVDQLVAKLERAKSLVSELERRLRKTRMRVEELVPQLQALGSEQLESREQGDTYEPYGVGFAEPGDFDLDDAGDFGLDDDFMV
jgi:exodeoxyribonuclease VII small subunit